MAVLTDSLPSEHMRRIKSDILRRSRTRSISPSSQSQDLFVTKDCMEPRANRNNQRQSEPPEHKSFYAREYTSGDTQPLESLTEPSMNTPYLSRSKPGDATFSKSASAFSQQMPRTPNVAGHKRRANGDLVSDPMSTIKRFPGSNFLNGAGRNGATLSLTQAFGDTQAETSPYIVHPKSDPVFERPSPQFQHHISSPTSPLFNDAIQHSSLTREKQLQGKSSNTQRVYLDMMLTQQDSDIFAMDYQAHVTICNENLDPNTVLSKTYSSPATPRSPDAKHDEDEELEQLVPQSQERVTQPSQPGIQVPRSSRNGEELADFAASQSSPGKFAEQTDMVEQCATFDGVTKDTHLPTLLLDRIPDSQAEFERQPQDQMALSMSSPSLPLKRMPLPTHCGKSALQSGYRVVLGTESQAALLTSTPVRPPQSSPPRMICNDGTDVRPRNASQISTQSNGTRTGNFQQEIVVNEAVAQDNISTRPQSPHHDEASSKLENAGENGQSIEKRRKLADIAAAPSQTRLDDICLDFDNTNTEAEKAYDEYMSGSSPVPPRPRRKILGRQQTRLADNIDLADRSNDARDDASESSDLLMQPSQVRFHHSSLPVNYTLTRRMPSSYSTSTLNRPKHFLGTINQKRQTVAKLSLANKPTKDVFDVEESQLQNQILPAVPNSPKTRLDSSPISDLIMDDDTNKDQQQFQKFEERFSNRIFAYWPAEKMWYPATYVTTVDGDGLPPRLDVIFDEGSRAQVPASKQNFKLELRPGDVVRVALKNLNKKEYVVAGLKDMIGDDKPSDNLTEVSEGMRSATDVYGHKTVSLAVKGRESVPGSTNFSNTIDVPMTAIKLSKVFRFEDRLLNTDIDLAHLGTGMRICQSAMGTPRAVNTSIASPSIANATTKSAILSGMVFAVSIGPDKRKRHVVDAITSASGMVIQEGFDCLFTPASIPTGENDSGTLSHYLIPQKQTESIGFVALLADDYSRKTKYMQALSLNLPILHYRWVDDCKSAGKVLPWSKYLLPAGKSNYLYEAVRSRTLQLYNPKDHDASLVEVLKRRVLIFQDKSILFVRNRNSQANELGKTCMFLLAALGASRVKAVADLVEAKREIKNNKWDFVYAHDAKSFTSLNAGSCQLLAHETIIQSLILGEYCHSETTRVNT